MYKAWSRWYSDKLAALYFSFCYHRWNVTSTIIGVTSVAQLDEDLV